MLGQRPNLCAAVGERAFARGVNHGVLVDRCDERQERHRKHRLGVESGDLRISVQLCLRRALENILDLGDTDRAVTT